MDWNSNVLWGILSPIIGIIVSLLFFYIGKKRKSLLYDITTTTLISNNTSQIESLSVKFEDRPINNLNASTIKIINSGNTIIESNNFAQSAPLLLKTNGEFLISSDNVTELITANDFSNVHLLPKLTENNICQETEIQFDFIEKRQVISCTVFHTDSIYITGKLKEGKIRKIEMKKDISPFSASIIGAIFGCAICAITFNIYLLFTNLFK